jgi:hypothetical protein
LGIAPLTHRHDIGYELTTQLLVDAEVGRPIAPIQMHWKTLDGKYSTAQTAPSAEEHRLEHILPLMQSAAAMHLSAQIVHGVGCEADSVFHYREWNVKGFQCLVRSDDERLVQWRGELVHYQQIVAQPDEVGWSDRRVKRGRSPTASILQSGLFVLFQMLDFLKHMDCDQAKIDQLKKTAEKLERIKSCSGQKLTRIYLVFVIFTDGFSPNQLQTCSNAKNKKMESGYCFRGEKGELPKLGGVGYLYPF